jgi:hypothetical protein
MREILRRIMGRLRFRCAFLLPQRQKRLALCALRQALALRGAGETLEIWSAALRPIPLGAWSSGWIGAGGCGGSFDFARMIFMLRWQELWPRFAQDVILKANAGSARFARDDNAKKRTKAKIKSKGKRGVRSLRSG